MIFLVSFIFGLSMVSASDNFSKLCGVSHLNIISMLKNREHRLAFSNNGGLLNGGVCWWHSRFERAAAYLADFRPTMKKPSESELKKILSDLSLLKTVIIPGHKNLEDLSSSSANEELIQKTLNAWQARDAFLNQSWMRGLSGRTHMRPESLSQHIKLIHETFINDKKPYFLMLQMPGVVAHAFLLLDIRKVERGHELHVVDSNRPGTTDYYYHDEGSSSLSYFGEDFVPYLGFSRDFNIIENNLRILCEN